jgi:hypothetical protein
MRNAFALLLLLALCLVWSCGRTPAPGPAPAGEAVDTVAVEQVALALPDSAVAPPPVPAATPAPQPTDNTLSAQFVEIQMGDYAHLVVRDAAGKRRSFFLADELPYSAWAALDTLPGMKGKRLALKWRHVTKYLDASGSKEGIDEVYEIRYP